MIVHVTEAQEPDKLLRFACASDEFADVRVEQYRPVGLPDQGDAVVEGISILFVAIDADVEEAGRRLEFSARCEDLFQGLGARQLSDAGVVQSGALRAWQASRGAGSGAAAAAPQISEEAPG